MARGLYCLLPIAYCLFVGQLAIFRQQNLQTNAFDLGYISQALWEDAHARFFQFTTVQGSNAVIEGVDLSRILHPHWLLAFHVEPALLLLAPLYRVWPDPRLLLWIQAAVIAAGALPAAWLAQRLIGGRLAGLVFGLAYLLAPGLEGAALSDFHMVALGAALLMAALWLWETGHPRWSLACFALTALCREDAALTVACVGIVLWASNLAVKSPPSDVVLGGHPSDVILRSEATKNLPEQRLEPGSPFAALQAILKRQQSLVFLSAACVLWTLLCFLVIEPFFSGGASAFAGRYAWLKDAVLAHDPLAIVRWLLAPDVRDYIGLQLLTGGVIALLAPLELAAAVPLLAINVFSGFDWMRSGGGHYSALLVPLLLWAAMHGVRNAKVWAGAPGATAASLLVLASALGSQAWVGVSPLHPGFSWPRADPRAAQVIAGLAAIPAQEPVSATSSLYPHLSARAEGYWFPSADGADWLAVDAAGTTHPLSPTDARVAALRWLSRSDVELVTAGDGLLVMHRRVGAVRDGLLANDPAAKTIGQVAREEPGVLPTNFYDFTAVSGKPNPLQPIRFGPLELLGYELVKSPDVGLLGGSATLATYWQAVLATDQDLHFALASTRQSDGALLGFRTDAAAMPLWLPTSHWKPDQTYRLDMDAGQLHGIQALGVAVQTYDGRRLMPSGAQVSWDGGTIAQVIRVG